MSGKYPEPPPSYQEATQHDLAPLQPPQQPTAPSASMMSSVGQMDPELLQELRMWFNAVDEDGNGHIEAAELQQALLDEKNQPFSLKTCRMLINMFDDNRNSEIEFDEFIELYHFVRKWRGVFLSYDDDNSGTIERDELHQALNVIHAPNKFGKEFCEFVIRTFGKPSKGPGCLSLDEFIAANADISKLLRNKPAGHHGVQTAEQFLRVNLNNFERR